MSSSSLEIEILIDDIVMEILAPQSFLSFAFSLRLILVFIAFVRISADKLRSAEKERGASAN